MSEIPSELRYTDSHEWVRENEDGTLTMGITDHAQAALGDLVYVELPDIGVTFGARENCAVVESVKAASDVYSPVSGEIMAINTALDDEPELINASPFENGWLMCIQPDDARELEELMDAAEYRQLIEDQ